MKTKSGGSVGGGVVVVYSRFLFVEKYSRNLVWFAEVWWSGGLSGLPKGFLLALACVSGADPCFAMTFFDHS